MKPRCALLAALVLAGLYATPRPAAAIWPTDPSDFLSVCNAMGDQTAPVLCSDGGGGVYVAWLDGRAYGYIYVFVQHVTLVGENDPEWPYNGLPVCTTPNYKTGLSIVPDAVGGAILAWSENRTGGQSDIYAQRVTCWGSNRWTANGAPVCTEATGGQFLNTMVADGNGGAILAWTDNRTGGSPPELYAQRLDSTGTAVWATNGVAVCNATGQQAPAYNTAAASDSAGGVILAWEDNRGGSWRIYAQRMYASGAAAWPTNGMPLCSAHAGAESQPTICADGGGGGGGGGAIIAWVDARAGNADIFAQSVSSTGTLRWAPTGLPVCVATGNQSGPMLLGGGGGTGAVGGSGTCSNIVWRDQRSGTSDIYAQRLTPSASPMWAANGVAVLASHTCSSLGRVLSDDSSGMFIVWNDNRNPDGDLYAQRLDSTGTPHWTVGGVAVATGSGGHQYPSSIDDGLGGMITTWQDSRSSGGSNVGAQRNAPNGKGGHRGGSIVSVRDVPNDQGGKVILKWQRAELDCSGKLGEGQQPVVTKYWVWRQAPAARAKANGPPAYYYWEFVAEQPAGDFDFHSYVASTTADSVSDSNPYTRFLVEARDNSGRVWTSDPDSGYSVDNLPPEKPSLFLGNYSGASTALHWSRNTEPDLAGYRLYRGASEGFVPGPGNLVVEKADTGYVDVVTGGHYYKLCAVDVHGNASAGALLTPQQTGGAPGDVPTSVWLGRAVPNPSSGNTRIGYGLPREARVSLTVHDSAGRLVRRLADGTLPAGMHGSTWDGRDDAGRRVASGLYPYRLTVEGHTLTGRLVLTR